MYRGENDKRVETFEHDGTCSIGDNCHDTQYDTETMEQRNRQTYPVVLGKFHTLTYAITVIGNIVVSEHHAFGKPCRTRGILHVYHIVAVEAAAAGFKFFIILGLSQQEQFGSVVHTPVLLLSDVNDVFHERKTFTVHISSLRSPQFGQHGIGHVYIVAVERSVGNT